MRRPSENAAIARFDPATERVRRVLESDNPISSRATFPDHPDLDEFSLVLCMYGPPSAGLVRVEPLTTTAELGSGVRFDIHAGEKTLGSGVVLIEAGDSQLYRAVGEALVKVNKVRTSLLRSKMRFERNDATMRHLHRILVAFWDSLARPSPEFSDSVRFLPETMFWEGGDGLKDLPVMVYQQEGRQECLYLSRSVLESPLLEPLTSLVDSCIRINQETIQSIVKLRRKCHQFFFPGVKNDGRRTAVPNLWLHRLFDLADHDLLASLQHYGRDHEHEELD